MRRHIMPVGVCDRRAAVNGGRGASVSSDDLMFILNAGLFFILVANTVSFGAPLALL